MKMFCKAVLTSENHTMNKKQENGTKVPHYIKGCGSVPKVPFLKKGETVLFFGDSQTAAEKGYVSIMEKKLKPMGIKVINAGLPGDKTPMALTRIFTDVIDQKPDAVCFYFGGNDVVIGLGQWRTEPLVTPEAFKVNLIWMHHFCKLNGIKKFSICGLPLSEGAAWDEEGNRANLFAIAAREAAVECDAEFVPLDTAFAKSTRKNASKIDANGLLYTKDGRHWNDAGCKLAAETIMKAWNLIK